MSMPPWELEWVPAGDDRDGLAVDADGGAEHRVVLEEVGRLKLIRSIAQSFYQNVTLCAARLCLKNTSSYQSASRTFVDDDDIERGVLTAVPAPEEVPAEPVDRLLELSLASAGAFSPVACHRFHTLLLVLVNQPAGECTLASASMSAE